MTRALTLLLAVAMVSVLCGCPAEPAAETPDAAPEVETPDVETPEVEAPATDALPSDPPQPDATDPDLSGVPVSSPFVDDPVVSDPFASDPEVTGPDLTVPEITVPEITVPDITATEITPPMVDDTDVTEPEATEPNAAVLVPPAPPIANNAAPAVAFGVASSTDSDPAVAAKAAVAKALAELGCPAKGLIFYEYFPKTVKNEAGEDKEVPDTDKEKAVLPAVRELAGSIPVIGCRARSLVTEGTMLTDTVAVMAIGGEKISCKAVKAELVTDRGAVGTAIAEGLKDVADLKLIMALSEMNLSFDTTEGISVEDFIRGALSTVGKDVTLFGGNCMPNDYETDKGGIQFIDDETLAGHVVALGIGGPIAIHANHTNEFTPSDETVTVTKTDDKWILELDGQPAADVYRRLREMPDDEEFTSDFQHPIGVIVAPEKVYLRMVLDWIDADGNDSKGESSDVPPGALRFVAAVPEGTKIKILKGGDDAQAILEAAKEGISQSLAQAGDAKPLVALLSDCCARGMRLRQFRQADECEIRGAIAPIVAEKGNFPIFGFYAWGELGPIAGEFAGLSCMYQQHTFVSAIVTEEE